MKNVATDEILAASDAPPMRFLEGDLVEVLLVEVGLRGSWHPAKVVEVHKGKRMVEYEELLDADEKTKLRETVSIGRASDGDNVMGTLPLKSTPKKSRTLLRPRPPAHPDSQPISWQEGVWVDCFSEDAWWEGVLAENTTTVNVDDVSMLTHKSEVDVFFPGENDMAKMSVGQMRIGQHWDEETGNWSLKGCVPVPVARPSKGSSKGTEAGKASAAGLKATDVGTESKVINNGSELSTLVKDLCQNVEVSESEMAPNNAGGDVGGSLKESLNVSAEEELPLESKDVTKGEGEAQNEEEAAQAFLTHAGWKVTRSVRRKTSKVTWFCRSPKVAGSTIKTFSSLVEALSHETQKGGASGGKKLSEAGSSSLSIFVDKEESSAARDAAIGEDEDENDKYATFAREILTKSGWEVFNSLRTGSDGQSSILYRSPGAGSEVCQWFKNWRLAIGELVKQEGSNIPNQKKRGGSGENPSPVPAAKRVTRRHSSPECDEKLADQEKLSVPGFRRRSTRSLSSPVGAKKLASPSVITCEDVPTSMFPDLSPGDYSDVDDAGKTEVVINSGRKRAPVGGSYLEKPFGNFFNFTEKEDAYTLQLTTHDFSKEQMSVVVEKGSIIIKAKYIVEKKFGTIPVRYNGSVSSRVILPKDVEREKITSELTSSLLTLTLPKCFSLPEDALEIKIQ